MALRQSGALVKPAAEVQDTVWWRWPSRNRVVRSAILVAGYSAAFFPLSELPGATAQFVSIVPIAVIASWLGMRGGLVVAFGFIPLLAALSVVGQEHGWDYLAFEGRPAALVSLIAMAAVAGRASDLGRRLRMQSDVVGAYVGKLQTAAGDGSRLASLAIELANAYTKSAVYTATVSVFKQWIAADRIAFVEIDEDLQILTIEYVTGVSVPGFETGRSFKLDHEWQAHIDADRTDQRRPNYTLPSDKSESWKAAGFGSVLRVPLKTSDRFTGYLALSSHRQDAFTEADTNLITTAAQYITPHIRAASLFDVSVRESGSRKAQVEVARAMSANAGLETLCQVASIQMGALLQFDLGFVAETEQGMNTLVVRHAFGERASLIENAVSFAWDSDFTHLDDEVRYWDLQTLEIGEDAYPFSLFASEGFNSVAMITLMAEGEPLGWLVLASREGTLESEYTSQLMQGIGSHLANAIVRERGGTEQKHLLRRLAAQNSELRAARSGLQESQDEIEKQNAELQRANEAKNTFLSAVSHELKTPLAIMVGFAELLGMNNEGNLTDQQLEQLRMVERNGRHLDLLVSDLVDVSRIESGRLAVNLEPTQPEELLAEILTGLDSIAVDKQQTIVRDFNLAGAWVRADRARLGQVVTNLITNACKYSPESSAITISACIVDHELVVSVADQGIGIAVEDQKKLFTPFFRSTNEEAHREKGTGLGLVITRSIVEMHGGTLDLESELGKGTVITVRMPGVMDSETAESPGDMKPGSDTEKSRSETTEAA